VGIGTKEDESSTGRVWAAGFHHVTARYRLARPPRLLNPRIRRSTYIYIYIYTVAEKVLVYLFLRFASVSYGRFIAIHYNFKLSTYVQETLVIDRKGCVQRET